MKIDMDAADSDGHGTSIYRNYVLFALVLIYVFDVVDRILFALVQEDIKADMMISDFQLGLLGGPAFALLYSLAGLPIAYWADRGNRVTIVSLGIAFWSFATAMCGVAHSFLNLIGLRALVGIGEAACLPPSHSLISDYFPARQRASAMAVYGLAIPIGAMIASIAGGWITAHFGWRLAFILLGLPGIMVALLVRLTVKDPPRAHAVQFDNPLVSLKALIVKPTFLHMSIGGALVGLYLYASHQFLVSFMVRSYGIALDVAAMIYGLAVTSAIGVGIFLGGFVADRLRVGRPRAIALVPVFGCLGSVPLFLLAFSQSSLVPMVVLVALAMLSCYFYMSPTFTAIQIVAGPRQRASASALSLLISTIIGYGFGPPLVGWIADRVRDNYLAKTAFTPAQCDQSRHVAECVAAGAYGLKVGLMVAVVFVVWAAGHFWLAGRTLHRDRVD